MFLHLGPNTSEVAPGIAWASRRCCIRAATPQEVERCMGDLERFLHSDTPAVVKAALHMCSSRRSIPSWTETVASDVC
jgi:hypothetical protein